MNVDTLRAVLLERAHADAAAILATAVAAAERSQEQAKHQADALIEAGRRDGEIARRREMMLDLRGARREAHERVLAAKRDAEQRLHRDALDAVLALRHDPAYPALLGALTRAARQRLGPHAAVLLDPHGRGGVIAKAGTRTLDLTLAALAKLALEDAGTPPRPDRSAAA